MTTTARSPIHIGPFELQRPAGSGATAVVWRGVHRALGTPVAIKVMSLPPTDRGSGPAARARAAQFRDLFAREVRAMASLDHPGIIRVHDHGTIDRELHQRSNGRLADNAPYVVMDWVDGGTLADRAELYWGEVRAVAFALLDALAHAHARGVIHRDLKPRNVLMGERGPVLTDFGIVHQESPDGGRSRTVRAGTPGYMAPEQIKHDPRRFGPWTDLYALGCLLYEMVAGHLPFAPRGVTSADALLAPTRSEPEPLYPRISVPGGFEDWLRRLIARSPADRFRYAADAARALAELPPPVAADRPSAEWSRSPLVLTGIAEPTAALTLGPATHEALAAVATVEEIEAFDPDMTLKDGVVDYHALHGESLDGEAYFEPTLDEPLEQPFDSGEHVESIDSFAPLRAGPGDPFEEDVESTLDQVVVRASATWIDPSSLSLPTVPGAGGAAPDLRVPIPPDWRRPPVPPPVRLPDTGSALADLREPQMQGREGERAVLWQMLRDAAASDRPRAVVVRGVAGIGKTRLSRWLGARTHELGVAETLVATHSQAPGVDTGLSAMLARHSRAEGVDLDSLVRHMEDSLDAPTAVAGIASALLTRDRSIRVGERTITLWTEDEAMRGLGLVLQHIAARRTLVVRIEDAQWAEEAVRFVDTTLQRNPRLPALFVLTVRDDLSARAPVQEALERIAARPGARTLRLGPLDPTAQGAIIDDRIKLDPVTRRRVIDRSGGHPLFATELICHWARAGALITADMGYRLSDAGDPLSDLDALWDARMSDTLAPFATDTFQAFEIAALLGNEVKVSEWTRACEIADVSTHEVRWALERLLDGRLIQTVGGGRWAFNHGLLREALERRASKGGRARGWHRHIADMLAVRNDVDPHRLADHLAAAGAPAEALPLVLDSTREALAREDLPAARRFVLDGARLLRRLERGMHAAEGIELRAAWAWVSSQLGRGDARRHGQRALDAAREAGDHRAEVMALAALGQSERTAGDAVQASVYLRRAMSTARKTRDPMLVSRSARWLCAALEAIGRYDEAEAVLDAVERLPGAADDARERGLRRFRRASVALYRGKLQSAKTHATAARDTFVDHGMRTDVMQASNLLGEIHRALSQLDTATEHYRVAYDIARELGHAEGPLYAINLGRTLLDSGRFDEARARFVVALREAARADAWLATVLARVSLLPCAAHAGHWSSWDTQWACLDPLRQGRYVHRDVARSARLAARLAENVGQLDRAKAARRLAVYQYNRLGLTSEAAETRAEGPIGR